MSETASRTSLRRSLEQQRAKAAWEAVAQVRKRGAAGKFAGEYTGLARSAPTDIQTNGLGQTLAFLRAKGFEHGRRNPDSAHAQLLDDISGWLRGHLKLDGNRDVVEWIVMAAETGAYRRATVETLAFLAWLRRFAEAELGSDGRGATQP